MNDKERLEQLKNGSVFDNDDINFLIEQAERVQVLEIDLDICQATKLSMDSVSKFTKDIKDENSRLREVLGFYADKSRYVYQDEHRSILNEKGAKARQAIKGESHE